MARIRSYMEELYCSRRERPETHEAEEVHITTEEIRKVIKAIRNNKVPGADEIPIEYIEAAGEDVQHDLVEIIKCIYKHEKNPRRMDENNIFVEISKKNGTIKCEEHRTIALIPHAMEIPSKVIYNRISAGL